MKQSEHVTQIMSKKLVTVDKKDSIRTAYQIMQERRIRHLPVSDAAGNIVGILSDRDVQRAIDPLSLQDTVINSRFLVEEFMSAPVQFVEASATVREVADHVVASKISALLVRGSHQRAVGIITTDDLLRYLVHVLETKPEFGKMLVSDYVDEFGYWAN